MKRFISFSAIESFKDECLSDRRLKMLRRARRVIFTILVVSLGSIHSATLAGALASSLSLIVLVALNASIHNRRQEIKETYLFI